MNAILSAKPAGYKPVNSKFKEAESFSIGYPDETKIHGDLITPIKKRSKIVLNDDDFLKRVIELEEQIKNEPIENILAIDECGNVFMHYIGDIDSVKMDTKYWNAAKVVTHNHPNGSILSGTDISHLCDTDCQEIRAVTRDLWHSVRRGESWENLDAETVKEEINDLLKTVELEAIKYAGSLNDVDINYDTKTKKYMPAKPEDMNEEDFEPIRKQTRTDTVVLYRIYSARGIKKYGEDHNFIYDGGEL